jgi:NTP pyrophosphatase (non-canonical NTP hydrolase)
MANEFHELRDRLRRFAVARNWSGFHSPRNLALALTGEIGELASELQWVSDELVSAHLRQPEARARLADEVADVLIYLVRFADVCGIDLLPETYAKIGRNEIRYPPAGPHETTQPYRQKPQPGDGRP